MRLIVFSGLFERHHERGHQVRIGPAQRHPFAEIERFFRELKPRKTGVYVESRLHRLMAPYARSAHSVQVNHQLAAGLQ